MITVFISAFFFLFNYIFNKDIVVEHNYLPRIEASSIADEVITFDLEKDFNTIRDLVITEGNYFITPVERDSDALARSVSKLDKSGKYIEEIYRLNEGEPIYSITYYPTKKNLIISHYRKIVLFNLVNNRVIKEVDFKRDITGLSIFKNSLYVASFENNEKIRTYYLESYDPSNLNLIKTEKTMKYEVSSSGPVRNSSMSLSKDNFYISMGEVNEIYSSADEFKNPVITFKNVYNKKRPYNDIIFSLNQGIIGKFATTGFMHLNKFHVYYYDLKTNEQFLTKIGDSSGIYDDIKGSGMFRTPKFTNSNEYMFSSKKNKLNGKGISVILLKIKS